MSKKMTFTPTHIFITPEHSIAIDMIKSGGLYHIFEKGTNDRIYKSENDRNLFIVKGNNVQLVVVYKDSYKISTIDKDNLDLVKQHNWIYKDDKYGGGIYCTKLKQYLHYYLYDPDGSCRKLDHIDGDRLNNIKSNIKIFDDDEILPMGVYYNRSSDTYEARFVFDTCTWVYETFSVKQFGKDGALERALKQRKKYVDYYSSINTVEYNSEKKKVKKQSNDNIDWI